MASIPAQFTGITALTKANVYYDGRVVSHTLLFPDGLKKTLGLIYPGKYHFNTGLAEGMEIVAGACRVKVHGQSTPTDYAAGAVFEVGAESGFEIEVTQGLCEYICTFIP